MRRISCLGSAALCLHLLSAPAAAATPLEAEPGDAQGPVALSEAELGGLRGGQSLSVANQTLTAIAAGNAIGGDVTAGAVNVTDSAFSGFSGFGSIVLNTGSQVSIQSGINISIDLHQ